MKLHEQGGGVTAASASSTPPKADSRIDDHAPTTLRAMHWFMA
jgi:hypothetical protein